jgi:hypothetical protein|tara:strand:- start:44823 stop:45662 length:840 start_codon:yes stop_codon:yes gene_type:complete
MTIRWIVQTNLGSGEDANTILKACKDLGIEAIGVEPIPMDTELRDIPPSDKPTLDIYYGSTNFIKNAYGVLDNFNTTKYKEHYGEHFLNHDCSRVSIRVLRMMLIYREGMTPDDTVFIRPVEDIKEFAGQVNTERNLLKWFNGIAELPEGEYSSVSLDTEIIYGTPKNITHEWRMFMIDGKFCTGSYYRCEGKGMFIDYMPEKVIKFAEYMSSIWKPDDLYVMDIAEVDGELYIVECNGWNSCGFYKSDIHKLVKEVTEHTIENYSQYLNKEKTDDVDG